MALVRSILALILSSLIITTSARHGPPRRVHQHRHEAVKVGKRQPAPPLAGPPPGVMASTTASTDVLTYITPSPSASPVAVTSQSQIVTSYVPQFTLCELPPIEYFSVSPPSLSAHPSTAPYQNYSVSIPPGRGNCTTIYSPTITMVCATTLTALLDKITVSECPQDITFSTEYGYVIVTPIAAPSSTSLLASSNSSSLSASASSPSSVSTSRSDFTSKGVSASSGVSISSNLLRRQASSIPTTITPGPSIETLTTYYLAPWTELTAGTPPTDVDLKVCRTFAANDTTECVREYQVWSTSLVTMTTTSVTSINISTTIHGMSQVLVETFVANVTEQLTTFSMSTTMDLEFQTEWTTTHSANRTMSTSTGPTVYETLTVAYASATS